MHMGLAIDATDKIAVAKGWSLPYALGVLSRWKMAPVYCHAILQGEGFGNQAPCAARGSHGREEGSKDPGARRGEAEARQRAANRHAAHDAKAIARSGAGLALESKSVGAFAAVDGDGHRQERRRCVPWNWGRQVLRAGDGPPDQGGAVVPLSVGTGGAPGSSSRAAMAAGMKKPSRPTSFAGR